MLFRSGHVPPPPHPSSHPSSTSSWNCRWSSRLSSQLGPSHVHVPRSSANAPHVLPPVPAPARTHGTSAARLLPLCCLPPPRCAAPRPASRAAAQTVAGAPARAWRRSRSDCLAEAAGERWLECPAGSLLPVPSCQSPAASCWLKAVIAAALLNRDCSGIGIPGHATRAAPYTRNRW